MPKNKLGLSLRKKRIFWVQNWGKIWNIVQKLIDFKEKKGLFGPKKKQAGAELGQKVGEKIEYKGQKLTNFPKKKKDFSGQKTSWGWA